MNLIKNLFTVYVKNNLFQGEMSLFLCLRLLTIKHKTLKVQVGLPNILGNNSQEHFREGMESKIINYEIRKLISVCRFPM